MVKGSVTYVFSLQELTRAGAVAEARDSIKARAGIGRSGTYDGLESTYEMHFQAARAEIAVAALTGGIVDESVSVRGHTKGNIIWPNGLRGFARYRSKRGWDLALKSNNMKHFYGDIGFLVWPEKNATNNKGPLEVMGWISRDEFAAVSAETEFLAQQPRLKVPVSQLHPMTSPITATWEPRAQQGALW